MTRTLNRMKNNRVLFFLKCGFFSFLLLAVPVEIFSQRTARNDSDFFSRTSLSALELYEIGTEFYNEKNWWSASEKFQEAVQKNPAYSRAWYMLAKCYYEMNQFDLAVQYIENAEKYDANNPDYRNLRAFCLLSLERFDEADAIFRAVLKKYPNNIEARFGLAELDLFNGRLTGAERFYMDALTREPSNVKALLSLALVSTELGKTALAKNYTDRALRAHADNEEVYYIAAYLSALNGDYDDAERKCLMAVQANGNYDAAYELLCMTYYAQERYQDVIDIADFRISRNRNLSQAWYMKGMALDRLGQYEQAISTWETGLEIEPSDEIMRAAFELCVLEHTALEDPRRKKWAQYHVKKGQDFQKTYNASSVRYEFQTALKINPKNKTARNAFAQILYNDGFDENYLEQLKFIKEHSVSFDGKTENLSERDQMRRDRYIKLSDTIEGFESLLENNLAKKWDINPFYLDKTRWNIGIFYVEKFASLYHCDISRIASHYLKLLFQGINSTSVQIVPEEVSGYADAYRKAHDNNLDYFIILSGDETERDIKLDARMYSARTGTTTQNFSVYKTGNDRFSGALIRLRSQILSVLPVRAKILDRSVNEILVDIGKSEGLVKDAVFKVLRKGTVKTRDTGIGLSYDDRDVLGTVTLSKVSEEISEGILSGTGFYDRVNSGDELILEKIPERTDPKNSQSQTALDTSPQATEQETGSALKGADLEISRTPSLIKMIKELN